MEPKKKFFLVIALLWTVVITYLSLATVDGLSSRIPIPYKDKIVHFAFYFGFVFWWNKGLSLQQPKSLVVLLVVALLYGILMEGLQFWITADRSADIFDIIANSIGAMASYYWIKRKIK